MKDRQSMLSQMAERNRTWEILIIGGGATGLGCAVDAISRGYRTLLLDGSDFAKGTSSRSTKLIHGGVRYLRQGQLALVHRALRERGLLKRNAPHLVHDLPFAVPFYRWWEPAVLQVGFRLYDALADDLGFGRSCNLTNEELIERLPTIEPEGLRGGVIYHDGQFDDARLAINLAQTAADLGATLVNYVRAIGLIKSYGRISGIRAQDLLGGTELELRAKVVVNATGIWCDEIRHMDDPTARPLIRRSQGVHLVLDKSFLPGGNALMVPRTDDGRVFFAIPWHERVLVGTTETPVEKAVGEPKPRDEEIDFLLRHASCYLTKKPTRHDILSLFAGIRPLIADDGHKQARNLSRDHRLFVSSSGLVNIAGGKWTTYRKMAEDTIDQAAISADLKKRPCVTQELPVHGYHEHATMFGELAHYGGDAPLVRELLHKWPGLEKRLHPSLSLRAGEVVWAVREEMAVTVEDVLARRSRALFLDARAAIEAAPQVAELMAREMGRDQSWCRQQVDSFRALGVYPT